MVMRLPWSSRILPLETWNAKDGALARIAVDMNSARAAELNRGVSRRVCIRIVLRWSHHPSFGVRIGTDACASVLVERHVATLRRLQGESHRDQRITSRRQSSRYALRS